MQKPAVTLMVKAARAAGNVLLRNLSRLDALNVVEKGRQDYASEVDLQAEQAAINNEATKLQMIAMLQQAEQRLIDEQRTQLNRRILSGSNTGFPSLRSSAP